MEKNQDALRQAGKQLCGQSMPATKCEHWSLNPHPCLCWEWHGSCESDWKTLAHQIRWKRDKRWFLTPTVGLYMHHHTQTSAHTCKDMHTRRHTQKREKGRERESSASYNIEHLYFNLLSLVMLSPQVLGYLWFLQRQSSEYAPVETWGHWKDVGSDHTKNEDGKVWLKSIRPWMDWGYDSVGRVFCLVCMKPWVWFQYQIKYIPNTEQ